MTYAATEVLEECWNSTKEFLLPFERGRWAKMMLVVLLTGGGFTFPNIPTTFPSNGRTGASAGTGISSGLQSSADSAATALSTASAASIVLAILALVIGFLVVSSVMELVFFRSLMEKKVSIRKFFGDHLGSGARYAGFRLGATLLGVLGVAAVILSFLTNPLLGVLLVLAAVPLFIVFGVFMGLTQNIVVPYMVRNGGGPVSSWKWVFGQLEGKLDEVIVFVLIRFVLGIITGVVSLIGIIMAALGVGLVFGLPGALLLGFSQVAGAIILALAAAVFILAVLAVMVPVQVFMYFHALKAGELILEK